MCGHAADDPSMHDGVVVIPPTTHYPGSYTDESWANWERRNKRVIADARREADTSDPIAWAVRHADRDIESIVDPWELAYAMRMRDRLAKAGQ